MIDHELLHRYQRAFGSTFDVALWVKQPDDTVNDLMRVALAGYGPPVTDDGIAARLRGRSSSPDFH